ncbi:MAG: hypothetical protein AB8G23_01980 [Myxococcota bacterium]
MTSPATAQDADLPPVSPTPPSSPSTTTPPLDDGRGGFTVAVGLGIGGIGQRGEASVRAETTQFSRPRRGEEPEPLFDPFGDSTSRDLIKGAVNLSAQFTGPKIEIIPTAPRIFFDAGIHIPIDGRVTIASSEGVGPQTVREPVIYADARFDMRWYAGVGLEFVAPQATWNFVVRPSLDYVGQSMTLGAVFEEEIWPRPLPREQLERTSSESLMQHGVGGRLALEAEMTTMGNFVPTFYVEMQAAYMFGDFEATLAVPGANWLTFYDIELDRVSAAGSAGFRLKWRGF